MGNDVVDNFYSDSSGIVFRDEISYGLMLKSIANLMPRKEGTFRNRMALQIFRECSVNGLVGFLVWNEVRRAVPYKVLQEAYPRLFNQRQISSMNVNELPNEWTRNCKRGRRRYDTNKQHHHQQQQQQQQRAIDDDNER